MRLTETGLIALLLSAQFADASPQDVMDARKRSAQALIESARSYSNQSRELLAQVEKAASEAKLLEGEARKFQSGVPIIYKPLKGAQLAAARRQFQLDLQDFAKHARQYKAHTEEVRRQFGACHANQDLYAKLRQELTLHCDAFHLPNVEPPHICVELGTSAQEAARIQNTVRASQQNLEIAEQSLKDAESRLKSAVMASGKVDAVVLRQHQLALKEQALVAEYARLKEEHKQLEVGRKALERSGVRVFVPSVRGKMK